MTSNSTLNLVLGLAAIFAVATTLASFASLLWFTRKGRGGSVDFTPR